LGSNSPPIPGGNLPYIENPEYYYKNGTFNTEGERAGHKLNKSFLGGEGRGPERGNHSLLGEFYGQGRHVTIDEIRSQALFEKGKI